MDEGFITYATDMASGSMTYDFHDQLKHSSKVKVIIPVLVLLMGNFYKVCFEMTSCDMIYIISFIKVGKAVQAILRFCIKNLRGCNCWYY
jgi:hypothetical protein